MAFRREIFDSIQFNEKLETFGGYAMAEDVEFSHRVFLSSDSPLLIPSEGDIRHHGVLESRGMVDERTIAMFFLQQVLGNASGFRTRPNMGQGCVCLEYSETFCFHGFP